MKISLLIFSLALVFSLGIFSPGTAQAALGSGCATSADCGGYTCVLKPGGVQPSPGVCGGPCTKTTEETAATTCQVKVGSAVGWVASTCTAAKDMSGKEGVCSELPKDQLSAGPQSGSQLLATVDTLTNWVFAVFVVLAIVFVLLAAFQFVTAGGDATKVGEARQKLIWAVVGIVIALLAKGLVPVVRSITGG